MGGTRVRVGVVTLLFLAGAAACGDSGGDGDAGGAGGLAGLGDDASEAGDGGGAGGGPGGGAADPCSLLQAAEIEQQFGDQGPVGEGEPMGAVCNWSIGSGDIPGTVGVTVARAPSGQSTEELLSGGDVPGGLPIELELTEIDVPGVDDGDAFFDEGLGTVWVRYGDDVVSVTAFLTADDPGLQGKLAALAQLAGDRL